MRTSKQENLRSAMTRGIETLNGLPANRRTGYGVGTLLGCVPGISRPTPPTVLVSSGPNCGDCDHDRAGPSPVTLRQPVSWTPTGRKPRFPAANVSRNAPPVAASQCSPGGMGGSAQSAAARARTRVASLIVIPPGRSARMWLPPGMATTRSTFPAAAQSGTPADAVTAGAGPWSRWLPPRPRPGARHCRRRAAARRQPDQGAGSDAQRQRAGRCCGVPFGLLGLTIADSLLCHGPAGLTWPTAPGRMSWTGRSPSRFPGSWQFSAGVADRVPDDLGGGDDVGSPAGHAVMGRIGAGWRF